MASATTVGWLPRLTSAAGAALGNQRQAPVAGLTAVAVHTAHARLALALTRVRVARHHQRAKRVTLTDTCQRTCRCTCTKCQGRMPGRIPAHMFTTVQVYGDMCLHEPSQRRKNDAPGHPAPCAAGAAVFPSGQQP